MISKFIDLGEIMVDVEKIFLLPNQFLALLKIGGKKGMFVVLGDGGTFRNDKNVPMQTSQGLGLKLELDGAWLMVFTLQS
jgi:hypothetical protein